MDPNDIPNAPKTVGFFARVLLWIASADKETLKQCPAADWDNIKAISIILLCVMMYQTVVFTLIGQKISSTIDVFRPNILIVSCFLSFFFMMFDSYAVVRSGYYSQGNDLLRRGGVDISGGAWARIRAGLFLLIRILLSAGMAQLTAIFLSLLIFSGDVTAQLHSDYLRANGDLLAQATTLVDRSIKRASEAADAEATRYDAMAGQVAAARQSQIDPAGGDAQVRQAQKELDDLLAEKARADTAVTAAETFETDELGGIKGAPGNSGQPGPGYRHRAALQRLADARAHAQDVVNETDATRTRLETIRRQRGAAGVAAAQQAKEQLPHLEVALKDEEAKLTAARDQLASLTRRRDDAIRQSVEASPGYVPEDTGLLAQLTALERVAGDDPKVKTVIILTDVVSFGFELAAVLAKVTAFVPTSYAAVLVAENYAAVVRIADHLMQKIEQAPKTASDAEILGPVPADEAGEASAQEPGPVSDLPQFVPDPFGRAAEQPSKRPRGRPRKTSLN